MKKILLFCCILMMVSGCDRNKNLVCSIEKMENDTIVSELVETNFEGNNILNAKIDMNFTVNEKYLNYIDSFYSKIEMEYNEYKNKNGIDITFQKSDDSVSISMQIDFEKLDNDSKNILGNYQINANYNDTKKNLEKLGYICKKK